MHILLDQLSKHLSNYYQGNDSLIVAISGGMDSMVLLHSLAQLDIEIIATHVNYHLRGEESNADETLIRNYCRSKNIKLEVLHAKITDKGKSIQVEARNIRYDFFEKIRRSYCAKFILTAHHQGDKIETAFFNLIRGTGIKGLSPFNHSSESTIQRPFINTSRREISNYADINCVPFRLDRTNRNNNYSRNTLRNTIIPGFSKIFSNYEQRINVSIQRLSDQSNLLNSLVESVIQNAIQSKDGYLEIHLEKLDHIENKKLLLKEHLRSLGFNEDQTKRALQLSLDNFNKKILSSLYSLYTTENIWYLVENNKDQIKLTHCFSKSKELLDYEFDEIKISLNPYSKELHQEITKNEGIHLDVDKINWPIEFRAKADGDSMHPYSLKGKVKKLKKIYNELQIPVFLREFVLVISDTSQIVAVFPYTIDYHYRITEKTKQILTIKYSVNLKSQ